MEVAGWVVCWLEEKASHAHTLDNSYVLMEKIKIILRCTNITCKTNEVSVHCWVKELLLRGGSRPTQVSQSAAGLQESVGGDGWGQ